MGKIQWVLADAGFALGLVVALRLGGARRPRISSTSRRVINHEIRTHGLHDDVKEQPCAVRKGGR